tara:strand:- start:664 stop:843 length:180 start_codon:yes stop_codon:yes gene_type:complete
MKIMYEVRTLLKDKEPFLKNFSKVAQYRNRFKAERRVKKDINEGYRSQIFEREVNNDIS